MHEELPPSTIDLQSLRDVSTATLTDKPFLVLPHLKNPVCRCTSSSHCGALHDYVQSGGLLLVSTCNAHERDMLKSVFGFNLQSGGAGQTFSKSTTSGTPFQNGSSTLPGATSASSGNPFTSLATYPCSASSLPVGATVVYKYTYNYGSERVGLWTVPYGDGIITLLAFDWKTEHSPQWSEALSLAIQAPDYQRGLVCPDDINFFTGGHPSGGYASGSGSCLYMDSYIAWATIQQPLLTPVTTMQQTATTALCRAKTTWWLVKATGVAVHRLEEYLVATY